MRLHDKQKEVVKSKARFKIIRAGRRAGKTKLEVEDMSYEAVSGKDRPIFYLAPTQTQARDIIWEELKTRLAGIGEPNESRLEMKVPTQDGGTSLIKIAGWENRENFRGQKAWKIYFDEVDTMKNFFIGFQEIFRPALTDLKGKAIFSGTPKIENPNLKRLEKVAETDKDYECFKFTTADNPYIDRDEIKKAKEELDYETFKQEYEAEYPTNQGSLNRYEALIDVFSNTVTKGTGKYLIVDVADDGTDKTVFSYWDGLEEYKREEFLGLNTEAIIGKIKDAASQEQIPYSHIAVDAIGVGSAVASNSQLDGIVGYKSSYSAIKTDSSIVYVPNKGYLPHAPILTSDYKNLRSQCVFTLAEKINGHKIASRVTGQFKEYIIEEVSLYQDASTGDGKRMATPKEKIKEILGRSPDHSDTWIMRMYFEIKNKMTPDTTESKMVRATKLAQQFERNIGDYESGSSK